MSLRVSPRFSNVLYIRFHLYTLNYRPVRVHLEHAIGNIKGNREGIMLKDPDLMHEHGRFLGSTTVCMMIMLWCFVSQAAGLGRLRPNTLVLGFKNDWRDGDMMNVETYCHMVQ